MTKRFRTLLAAGLSIVVLTSCGLHTQAVEPREPDYINAPTPTIAPVVVEPTPNYYHVYVDEHSNVICVDTDVELNFFAC